MRDQRPMREAAIEALVQGRNGDPFALLGPHREGEGWVIRALLPGARAVTALAPSGETLAAFRRVGAHPMTCEGILRVRFAVWAPNARRVSVIGAFNSWDGRRHPMRLRCAAS